MTSFQAVARSSRRMMSTTTPYFKPTLVDTRKGEAGRGGRSSEAGCKVAIFGASGFLGKHLCAELGTSVDITALSARLGSTIENGIA